MARDAQPQELPVSPPALICARLVPPALFNESLAEQWPWPPLDLRMSYPELRAWLQYLLNSLAEGPPNAVQDAALDSFLLACAVYQCEADGLPAPLRMLGVPPTKGLRVLVDLLADVVSSKGATVSNELISALPKVSQGLAANGAQAWVHLRWSARQHARLPTCFRSMDLSPEDCEALASRLVAEIPTVGERGALVIGLRTSGCYLAPLVVASLRQAGNTKVGWVTVRPGATLDTWTSRQIHRAGTEGRVAVIVDDPPATGHTIKEAAELLRRRLPASVPLVALLPRSDEGGPSANYPGISSTVTLAWEDWYVVRRLHPEALRELFNEALSGQNVVTEQGQVLTIESCLSVRVDPLSSTDRGHTSRHVVATFAVRGCAAFVVCELLVQGVGTGYFGLHSLKVHLRLRDWLPRPFAYQRGLLVREYLPNMSRLSELDFRQDREVRRTVVSYVAERAKRLALVEIEPHRVQARSRKAGRTRPARLLEPTMSSIWRTLVDACGPWTGPFGQLSRRLALAAENGLPSGSSPCLIDADMSAVRWYRRREGGLCKTAAHQRALSNYDLDCADPLFDIVGAATAAWPPPARTHSSAGWADHRRIPSDHEAMAELEERELLSTEFRLAWESLTNQPADTTRWLVYTIVQHATARRDLARRAVSMMAREPEQAYALSAWAHQQLATRALQRYLGWCHGPIAAPPAAESLVAVDIDGVLETYWIGIPASTPAAISSLRAMAAHGLSPVLASGRPMEEVKFRCTAYGLAGGVAEFGSSIWVATSQTAHVLAPAESLAGLQTLRAVLKRFPRVFVHPGTTASVRASVVTIDGFSALPLELARRAITLAGAQDTLRIHQGRFQTDFVAASMNKAKGLQALASALRGAGDGADAPQLLAAVGDDEPDREMLMSATIGFAPSHSPTSLRQVAHVIRGQHRDLMPSVARHLIGHAPGACPLCQDRHLDVRPLEQVLDALLDLRGSSARRKAARLLRVSRSPQHRRGGSS